MLICPTSCIVAATTGSGRKKACVREARTSGPWDRAWTYGCKHVAVVYQKAVAVLVAWQVGKQEGHASVSLEVADAPHAPLP